MYFGLLNDCPQTATIQILKDLVLDFVCPSRFDTMTSLHISKACVRVLRSTRSCASPPQALITTCCRRAIHHHITLKPPLFAQSVSRPSLSNPVTPLARKTQTQGVRTLFIQTENTPNADVSYPSQFPLDHTLSVAGPQIPPQLSHTPSYP